MTYEEAIKQLVNVVIYHQGKTTREALDMAIEALEKQIPMKPINDWSESPFSDDKGCLFLHTMCPNCKKVEVNEMDSFCFNCGQAIDWEVSE